MAVMYIGKGLNIFYKWLDGKHIQLFHLSLIVRCVHYEYVGLVNYQYFKKNFWKDAVVKEACFYTSQNAEGN